MTHADVLDAYADGLPHRTSEIAETLGLSRYNKLRLQGVTSELYRTGRLERVGLLGHFLTTILHAFPSACPGQRMWAHQEVLP